MTDITMAIHVLLAVGLIGVVLLQRSEGGGLVVEFRWMGSSQLRYRISENPTGFRAEFDGERISPFHSPFRGQFEDRFEKVINAVGATVV